MRNEDDGGGRVGQVTAREWEKGKVRWASRVQPAAAAVRRRPRKDCESLCSHGYLSSNCVDGPAVLCGWGRNSETETSIAGVFACTVVVGVQSK